MDDTNANQINPSIRGLTENEVKTNRKRADESDRYIDG